jgi:archaetidylinositol phosphate synthase
LHIFLSGPYILQMEAMEKLLKKSKIYSYMVLNKYRYLLPRFTDGPVNWLIKHNVRPNAITVYGFLITVIAAVTMAFPQYFLYNDFLAWFPGLMFFISGYFDVLDGAVARKTGQVSKFGGFFDSTLDRLSDAIVILGLIYSNLIFPWNDLVNELLGFIALITIIMISYTRSRAELEGVVMKGIGVMERAERIFFILGIYIIEYWVRFFCINVFFIPPITYVFPILFGIFTLLCIQTLWKRISWTYKWLENKIPEETKEELRNPKPKVDSNSAK